MPVKTIYDWGLTGLEVDAALRGTLGWSRLDRRWPKVVTHDGEQVGLDW